MKGISLPIEMVIVLSIAVIVLLAVVAYFVGGFSKSGEYLNDAQAWQVGCGTWKNRGCEHTIDATPTAGTMDLNTIKISMYDYNKDGIEDSLWDVCQLHLSATDQEQCWDACCGYGARPDIE